MIRVSLILSVLVLLVLGSCKTTVDKSSYEPIITDSKYFHKALGGLTDVIVHDIFSPPVASRVYVYPCIAAYETISKKDSTINSLAGKLTGLTASPDPKNPDNVSLDISALAAFYKVAQALIFSEDKLQAFSDAYFHELDSLGVPNSVINASKEYGELMATHIIAWMDKDNYKESRSFSKFSLSDDPARWKPTPPGYMEGIEPHWNKIRTMVLDSAQQYKIAPPPAFDLKKNSDFRKFTDEVYEVVNNINEEERAIASFWDCNPFVMNQTGHIMYATKKITPGGHWMGISTIASKKMNHSIGAAIKSSTLVAISLFDAFIACWDEKYRSSLVRPETVINEYVDEDWLPILQTPPFPEHTSGHSVISTAASEILTAMFGDTFAYDDDVELKYGLPIRSYNSFREAASEAAISRLYGGIHYMPAIKEGEKQGVMVGAHIIDKLNIEQFAE